MKQIRKTTVGAVTVTIALGLTACSGDGESDTQGTEVAGDVSIEWWLPNWDEEPADQVLADFAEVHPEIEVETVITTWDTMANQIRVALDSGTVPDVITELTSRIPIYGREGQLVDVAQWFDDEMPLDDFYDTAIDAASLDGAIYGVPFRWDASSMIYNKELFEQAGIESAPTTWAQLQEAAKALQDIGVYAYGWPFGDPGNATVRWLNEYYTQGGEFAEESDGTVGIDADASERAIEVVTEGFDEGYVTPSSLEASNTDLDNLFINGQIAFYSEGAYAIKPIQEAGIDVGTAMWPGPDGPGTVSADGFSYIVPEGAENLEAVETLVKFLALPENQVLMTHTFPARYSAAEDESFSDPLLQPFLKQQSEYAMKLPSFVGWEELKVTIHGALQSVALGNQSVAEANAAIIQHAESILRVS